VRGGILGSREPVKGRRSVLRRGLEGGRRVGLVISDTKGRKRVVCEYLRENKSEKLEIAAKKLVKELAQVLKRSRRP